MVAGLTVGGLLVPQSMAYAELAGVRPVAGLHAALWALVADAAIGSSRHLGVGPEPGTALIAAGAVAGLAGHDSAHHLRLMGVLAGSSGSCACSPPPCASASWPGCSPAPCLSAS